MKKILLLGVAAFALVGCKVENSEPAESRPLPAYYRDARTGLCFAAVSSQSYSAFHVISITNVPCEAIPDHLLVG